MLIRADGLQVIENQSQEEHACKKPKQADKQCPGSAISPAAIAAETPLESKGQGSADRKRAGSAQKAPAAPATPAAAAEKLDASIIGRRCRIYWKDDEEWYEGEILDYNTFEGVGKHVVEYDDGEVEAVVLKREKFELLPGAGDWAFRRACMLNVQCHGATGRGPRPVAFFCMQCILLKICCVGATRQQHIEEHHLHHARRQDALRGRGAPPI